jgi:hypothetical protein
VTANGRVGIGTPTPGAKLEVAGAIKVPAVGTLIFNDPNETGTPGGDRFRIRYENHFYGTNLDALIIEKTDGNNADPDGGISFVNTGSDGVVEPALTIRGNGHVGIGTTTPGAKLHVYDNSNGEIRLEGVNKARFLAYSGGQLWIQSGSSWTFGSTADIRFSGMFGSPIHMTIQGSTGNVGIGTRSPGGRLHISGGYGGLPNDWATGGNSLVIGANGPSPDAVSFAFGDNTGWKLHFGTPVAGIFTPRVTIVDVGNVGIGTTNPSYRLHVVGYVGAYDYYYVSDQRWKTNIKPIQNALDNVLKMQGVTYYWKVDEYPDKHFPEGEQIGFIAQEIEKVYPQVVHTDKDGYKSVDYSKLTPVLVEAIKEQQKIMEELQKVIQQLQEENSQIKQANAQLSAEIKMLNEKVDNLMNSLSNDKKLGYR